MMSSRSNPHTFHSLTISMCSQCDQLLTAKVLLRDGAVYLRKLCPAHGLHEELLEEDADYYLSRYAYDKPGTAITPDTTIRQGCPHDCGLCPSHEQHTCIGLLEVTSACDLGCPVCFASSGDGEPLPLEQIERMLDAYVAAEGGEAEILQISGGEPTTHPQILDIIRLARSKAIRYVMLNTNGLRLAADPAFAEALGEFHGRFEVYLQFDSLSPEASVSLRGRDLTAVKAQALQHLAAHGVPVTLVTTVQQGVNEGELGRIVAFGLEAPNVRGINFQPLALFGRHPAVETAQRVTLSGVLRRLEGQTNGMLRSSDFVPLPCDVDRVAVTYLYRDKHGAFVPITRNGKVKEYLPLVRNTLFFDAGVVMKDLAQDMLAGQSVCQCLQFLKDFLPLAPVGRNLTWPGGKPRYAIENTFRISVTSFVDRYNFDMKALQKECVHVLTPGLRRIPFSAYNLLHRVQEPVNA